MGLENVHLEPDTTIGGTVNTARPPLLKWKPRKSSLVVTTSSDQIRRIQNFPVPFAAPVRRLDLQWAAFDEANPSAVAGKASMHTNAVLTIPATILASLGSVPTDMTGRIIDDAEHSLATGLHTLPFKLGTQEQDKARQAGAAAFIGVFTGAPGDTYKH